MKSIRLAALFLLILLTLLPATVRAEEIRTFAVTPFAVHGPDKYQYLSQGIQSMLISRLSWPGKMEAMDRAEVNQTLGKLVETEAEAKSALPALNADYLVWGSATILGEQASVDVNVQPREGQAFTASIQTGINDLIPSLEGMASKINTEVFNRPTQQAVAAEQAQGVNPLNPDLIYNESGTGDYYLNPEFRYQGPTETPGRWRGRTLPFISLGMIVTDADGDGKNETFIIEETRLHAFRVENDRLVDLQTFEPGSRYSMLNINHLDINRDGYEEIVVSALHTDKVSSFIVNFKDGRFEEVDKAIPYFLNVVRVPPEYSPVLIGQRQGRMDFFRGEVHEMIKMSGKWVPGRELPLPDFTNVFNFTYLPQGDDYKIIMADTFDKLRVFTPDGEMQASTDDIFAASSVGMERYEHSAAGGMTAERDRLTLTYYIPSRMIPTNLDGDENFELLVSHNISVAAQFFERYRHFPQGEIHNLFWDGVGLNLFWKTRRIKGSIVDYGIADINNDGQVDLYVCLNTHPGATGLSERRTRVISYSLDIEGSPEMLRPEGDRFDQYQ